MQLPAVALSVCRTDTLTTTGKNLLCRERGLSLIDHPSGTRAPYTARGPHTRMMMNELAKRAVACKAWRWMPGILTTCGVRVVGYEDTSAGCIIVADAIQTQLHLTKCRAPASMFDALPDLTDPATIGCLFSLALDAGAACPAWLTVEQLVDSLEHAP